MTLGSMYIVGGSYMFQYLMLYNNSSCACLCIQAGAAMTLDGIGFTPC